MKFLPDAGVGVYSFRAHLKKATGQAADWSPVASVTVS